MYHNILHRSYIKKRIRGQFCRSVQVDLTLWLRSETPADLKSGNLMPAVSGTACHWTDERALEESVIASFKIYRCKKTKKKTV